MEVNQERCLLIKKNMKIKTYKEAIKKVFVIEETRDYSLERVEKAMELL